MNLFAVIIGGFIGSISRALMSQLCKKSIFATFIVNLLGSIILAFTFKYYLIGQLDDLQFDFLGIGFAGSFTTFSTFSVELIDYLKDKKYFSAFIYLSSSILLALTAIYIIL